MKSRALTFLSICALLAGVELSRAFDAHLSAAAQTPDRMWFTGLPPSGTPVNVADLIARQPAPGNVSSRIMVAGLGQICLLSNTGVPTAPFFPYDSNVPS